LQESLGTKLIEALHTIHKLMDRLSELIKFWKTCSELIIHYGTNWDKCLALAEFFYNNSYQSSLQMAPFEALYGRRCQTPLSWSETGERKIFGPDLVTEAENKVKLIQANLKAAQSRQKSYADQRRKPLQFQVGDYVYLRVSPTKGVQRFGIKEKLAPRYIGPFEITEACGLVAYRIRLPTQLAAIHDVFHISQLKKCIKVPTEVIEQQAIEIEPDLFYVEQPLQILDTKERVTRRKKLKMYKILWDHHTIDEATWETEDYLRKNFPDFLKTP
jgi:hypothetical protein